MKRRTKDQLRGAQQRGVTALYESAGKQAVVPMGGGKTATAMTAIAELIEDGHIRCALVMAPKNVCRFVWGPGREHDEWEHLKDLKIQLVVGTPAQRLKKLFEPGFDIYVVGKDLTAWLCDILDKLPKGHHLLDLLCIDELSTFKNPRGVRSKRMRKLAPKIGTIWGLTGSPRPNGYEDQFALMQIITRGKFYNSTFDKWLMQRFTPDQIYDIKSAKWDVRPEWEERIKRDIARYSFTVAEEDLPELDPIQNVIHWVELPAEAMRVYKTMERELIYQGMDQEAILAANAAVASGKLAQIVQGFIYDEERNPVHIHDAKTEKLAELIEACNGQSALISYEFREDLKRMQDLIPGLRYFGGGVSDTVTQQNEKLWNSRSIQFLGLHPASAGHGLNLQFGGSQCILYGMPWSAELYDQMLKRFHRPGQRFQCFAHHIFARDTVDEMKYERVVNKLSAQEAFRKYLDAI